MILERRLKRTLAVFSIGCIVIGVGGIADSLRYRSPKTVSYSDFVREHPDQGWFTITGGTLDLANAVLPDDRSTRAYYVPLRPTGETQQEDVPIVAYVTDDPTLNQIDAYNNESRKPTTVWAMEHPNDIPSRADVTTISGNVSGMIGPSPPAGEGEADKIPSELNAAPGFVTINKDGHPNFLMALAMIAVGLVLGVVALWSYGIQPSVSATKEYVQHVNKERQKAAASAQRPYPQPGQQSYPPPYPAQPPSSQPAPYPPQSPPTASAPPRFQPTAPAQVQEEPSEMVDKQKEKEDAEIAKLREMKAFDPFSHMDE